MTLKDLEQLGWKYIQGSVVYKNELGVAYNKELELINIGYADGTSLYKGKCLTLEEFKQIMKNI